MRVVAARRAARSRALLDAIRVDEPQERMTVRANQLAGLAGGDRRRVQRARRARRRALCRVLSRPSGDGPARPRVRRRRRVRLPAAQALARSARRERPSRVVSRIAVRSARARVIRLRELDAALCARRRAHGSRAFKAACTPRRSARGRGRRCPTGCGSGSSTCTARRHAALARACASAGRRSICASIPLKTHARRRRSTRLRPKASIATTPYAPLGICASRGRPSLAQHPWLVDGRLEVQDEGSQLIGYLVAPRRDRHGRRLLRRAPAARRCCSAR